MQPCEHFVAPVAHTTADAEAARSGAQVAPVAQGADGGAEQFGGFGDGEQIRLGRGGRGSVRDLVDVRLRAQMQAYSACDDPEIRAVVRAGYGDLVAYVRRVSGADWPTVWSFFASGMRMTE